MSGTISLLFFLLYSFCLIKQFRYPISYVSDIIPTFAAFTIDYHFLTSLDKDDDDGDTTSHCLVFVLRINPATCVLCEVERGEQQAQLRLDASEAIYVAMAEVNTAPSQMVEQS